MGTQHKLPLLLAALAAACTSSPAPVPVVGAAGDIALLAGEWSGRYDSPATERRGTIIFRLEAGRDTAHGDVTMIPRGWTRPLGPAQDPAAVARDAPIPEVLKIRFVRLEGGKLSGTLDPYRDPDCGCAVYTTFTGVLKGDAIEGTFIARPSVGLLYRGTWQATRKKKEGG
ncbi:MAG: hypothetical protein JSV41_09000 [Gemmatimonadota bacterium]|nr:MAG: hypothetical protein JSV41_09000 [Gemmatimonadota bacterium]